MIMFWALTIFSMVAIGKSEVFTAMADIESLLYAEKHVTSVIDQYIESEMRRLEKLKEVALEYNTKKCCCN
jgi:prolyl 4-hydroxylase